MKVGNKLVTRLRQLMRSSFRTVTLGGIVAVLVGSVSVAVPEAASAAQISAASHPAASHPAASHPAASPAAAEDPECDEDSIGDLWYNFEEGIVYICAFEGQYVWQFYGFIPKGGTCPGSVSRAPGVKPTAVTPLRIICT
jgi:hypothetical protein